ncbi:c-type cytochrome [Massilia endophytica]|uniref:c-type cytochrome n=1 Tax=Massilia endophytica TaxID=2899220 RepID=UPI001E38C0A5|nr:c-type cytochrome [Massilia endophytica]UGQ46635.1 cytochrome C [Massilia endophytica]
MIRTTLCMLLLPLAGIAAAADANLAPRLAATCSGCHGTNGKTVGNALPALAGQPRDVLVAKLKAFKAGSAPSTIMSQLAKGYTDEQLEQIAAWFATQRK